MVASSLAGRASDRRPRETPRHATKMLSITVNPPSDMTYVTTTTTQTVTSPVSAGSLDQQVIGRAIRSELARAGQVYFVHNRVESIFSIGQLVQRLVPEARVVVGHGQMDEEALERAMLDFVAKKFDVLLATTIAFIFFCALRGSVEADDQNALLGAGRSAVVQREILLRRLKHGVDTGDR
jgi:superfamily II DNA/RNA helicase